MSPLSIVHYLIERHSLAACSTSPLPHPLSPEMPAAPSGYASPTVLAVSRSFGDSYIYLFIWWILVTHKLRSRSAQGFDLRRVWEN